MKIRKQKMVTAKSIQPQTYFKCKRVYPVTNRKNISDLKSVGICLSPEEAKSAAASILLLANAGNDVYLTGYRKRQGMTITSIVENKES